VVVSVMLAREVLIALATIGLALAGARRIDVVWAGKAGTLALMFSLPMFLGADATRASWHAFFIVCAWGFAIGGVALGYYAAAKYVPAAKAALREGRAPRAVVEVGS
jgi:cardiolipin synthase